MDINENFEKRYNNLDVQTKKILDDALNQCLYDGHINICKKCSETLFALPNDVDFTKENVKISEDFFIDSNTCSGLTCEIGDCECIADYTLNIIEE